jgi:hypothetical protein
VTDYLKLDSTRISFAEYWRWKPGFAFIVLAVAKLIGLRIGSGVLVPATPRLDVVDPGAQPPELTATLAEPIRACESRARTLGFWYTVPTLGPTVGLGAALISGDGLSVAMAVASHTVDGLHRDVVVGLVTRLRGGRFVATGPGKSMFNGPPDVEGIRLRGRSYLELVDAHDRLVQQRAAEVVACGGARELILELQRLQVQANVARGIYVPALPAEVERMAQLAGGRRTTG